MKRHILDKKADAPGSIPVRISQGHRCKVCGVTTIKDIRAADLMFPIRNS